MARVIVSSAFLLHLALGQWQAYQELYRENLSFGYKQYYTPEFAAEYNPNSHYYKESYY